MIGKVLLQGEWKSGRVWVAGREVRCPACRMAGCGRHFRFSWGISGSGAYQLALAVLLELLQEERAVPLQYEFFQEVITQLPQTDFKTEINMDNWMRPHQYKRESSSRRAALERHRGAG